MNLVFVMSAFRDLGECFHWPSAQCLAYLSSLPLSTVPVGRCRSMSVGGVSISSSNRTVPVSLRQRRRYGVHRVPFLRAQRARLWFRENKRQERVFARGPAPCPCYSTRDRIPVF